MMTEMEEIMVEMEEIMVEMDSYGNIVYFIVSHFAFFY
jgi:hypothetical protein